MKKNLILGLAASYDWAILRNFVCSLRQTFYKDEVILFVSPDVNQATRKQMTRRGIRIIDIDGSSPYLKGMPSEMYEDPSFFSKLPPSVYRMLVFYNFLMENGHNYRHVLITDVRDVVFQNDPFAFDISDKMCFFMESKTLLLKDSDWNALWTIAIFGVETLFEIGNNLISNVGTVIGPVEKMTSYLALLLRHLMETKVYLMFGIEQAAHNYLLINKEVDDYLTFYTEEGPVATLSCYKDAQLSENGYYVNASSKIPNVVHQYDRHPALKSYYDHKFQ